MDDSLKDLLALTTMTLSTANSSGKAHAAPVYFAALQNSTLSLELYFFSAPESRHIQDLVTNPHAAAAIYPETTGWEDIRGLQLEGSVHRLPEGTEWDAAWQVYLAKFPFTSTMKEIIAQNAFYAFQVFWIRLVDNRLGFGYKQEWTFDDQG